MTKPFQMTGYLPRMRPAPDLVGIAEIAERHGTSAGTIRSWRYRHKDFPAPMAELAMGPVWDWYDMAAWLGTRGKAD